MKYKALYIIGRVFLMICYTAIAAGMLIACAAS